MSFLAKARRFHDGRTMTASDVVEYQNLSAQCWPELLAVVEAVKRLESEFAEFDTADGRTFDALWDALDALDRKADELK